MTRLLAEFLAGSRLEVWGPLGNGFPPTPAEHLVMVAGGIGQTPFLMLAREYLGPPHGYGESAAARSRRSPARSRSATAPARPSTWPASTISAGSARRPA